MADKEITNTAELGSLSYMGLDNYITRVMGQIADGIKDGGSLKQVVDVKFDLVVEGQSVSFTVPVSVAK